MRLDFSVRKPYFSPFDPIANFAQNHISVASVRRMPVLGDIGGKFFFGHVKDPRLLTPFQMAPFFVRLQ
jgi:hypothetical protein